MQRYSGNSKTLFILLAIIAVIVLAFIIFGSKSKKVASFENHNDDIEVTDSVECNSEVEVDTLAYLDSVVVVPVETIYVEEKEVEETTGYINGHEWVDLGLPSGTKWATCNIGASSPEDYGDYFAWGEAYTKMEYTDSNSDTYDRSVMNLRNAGIIDVNGNLTSDYDAAYQRWGSGWRMPTKTEIDELRNTDYCTWRWTTQNGTNGCRVTGLNGNSIFLPAAGYRDESSLDNAGGYGHYWNSTVFDSSYGAYSLLFFVSDYRYVGSYYRYCGLSVRPVAE